MPITHTTSATASNWVYPSTGGLTHLSAGEWVSSYNIEYSASAPPVLTFTINGNSVTSYHSDPTAPSITSYRFDDYSNQSFIPGYTSGTYSITYNTIYPSSTLYINADGMITHAKKENLRQKLKGNLISPYRKRIALISPETLAEEKARISLRDMLPENEWRRYVTNGFIMVKGKSGKWYQIFNRSHERVRVYEKGIYTTQLCIHTVNECPPTDHVLNIKFLAEFDEDTLWAGANITKQAVSAPRLVAA